MEEVLYCGKAKEGRYGINVSVCLDDLFAYAKDNIKAHKNGKKYIQLDVNKMKQPDQYGNEYTVKINTYVPQPKLDEVKPNEEYADTTDLPF